MIAAYYDNPNFAGEPVLQRVDDAVDLIWKNTTPLTGQWGDSFSVRWTGFLVPPSTGSYTIGVNGFSNYNLYLDEDLLVTYDGIHHPRKEAKEIELEAGRSYRIRLDYVNRGLDPQVQLLWAVPGVDHQAIALEIGRKSR